MYMHCRPIPLLAFRLCQRRLGLRQPESHVHGTVEVQSSRECGAGLLLHSGRGIQGTEAAVAVGRKRAHAECLGEGEGLAVVGFGLVDVWWLAPPGDLAQEPAGLRLIATLLVDNGVIEGTTGHRCCLL